MRFLIIVIAVLSNCPTAQAKFCTVVDGAIAELAPGPFMPGGSVQTLKSAYRAEFRWNPMDPEGIGWMRITDEAGSELGWVPAGHEAVKCGENN